MSTYSALEKYRPRYYPPYDYHLYPYLWDDSRLWLAPYSLLNPMDELVTRRVRNQYIQSRYLDWAYPVTWNNYYNGERVHIDEKGFKVQIDVSEFKPGEIVVKTDDDYIIVEGKHNRRSYGDSYIERRFLRKYLLPRGYNPADVMSDLSSNGYLTIKVPPPPPTHAKDYKPSERIVRVFETGNYEIPWK